MHVYYNNCKPSPSVISPVCNNSCGFSVSLTGVLSSYTGLGWELKVHVLLILSVLGAAPVQMNSEGSLKAGVAGGRLGNLPSVMQCFSETLIKAEGSGTAVCTKFMSVQEGQTKHLERTSWEFLNKPQSKPLDFT